MTLVVTTVSQHGITVVGDKAASWDHGDQTATSPTERKVFVSRAARIGVAIWGSTRWPGGGFGQWVGEFVSSLGTNDSLWRTACRYCEEINAKRDESWDGDRRGAHFAGFVDGIPHLYHAHTGDEGAVQHEMRVFKDFPDIHGGGDAKYRTALAAGHILTLRNGLYRLHALVGGGRLNELRTAFERDYGRRLPAPSLEGELWLSAALVRFAGALVVAAGDPGTVSDSIDGFAFAENGDVIDLHNVPPFRVGKRLELQDGANRVGSGDRIV